MPIIIFNGPFADEHILASIERLNSMRRPAILATILEDLHARNLYSQVIDYMVLFNQLMAMRSRGLLTWVSPPEHLGSNEEVELVRR